VPTITRLVAHKVELTQSDRASYTMQAVVDQEIDNNVSYGRN